MPVLLYCSTVPVPVDSYPMHGRMQYEHAHNSQPSHTGHPERLHACVTAIAHFLPKYREHHPLTAVSKYWKGVTFQEIWQKQQQRS
jgi:hypothetical protein